MNISIETIRTGGFAMRYFRFGRGDRTMVILPGLSVQSVMDAAPAVAAAYECMTADFTVYVFDRREELPEVYTIADMARDTAAAMQAVGLKDVCLFGASQGGMIAQVLAIEHPALVRAMVLGSTSPNVQPEQFAALEQWIDMARKRDGVGLYLSFGRLLYPPALFEQYRPALIAAGQAAKNEDLDRFMILAAGTRDFNVVDRLPEIRCPVLAIGVFEDAVVDSDATMQIAEKLDYRPDFRLYMYIGYGHAAYDTAPDYRDRMRRFFREQEGERT